jgi:dynein assembly factor 5
MNLQREINILGEPTSDRNAKRQALQKLVAEAKNTTDAEKSLLFFQQVSQHVLKTVADPVEKCRELSVDVLI